MRHDFGFEQLVSFRYLLVHRLRAMLQIWSQSQGNYPIPNPPHLTHQPLPLRLVHDLGREQPIVYRCPIPLQLARYNSRSAAELAQQLASLWYQVSLRDRPTQVSAVPDRNNDPYLNRLWQSWTVEGLPTGWLEFVLSDEGLMIWLQGWGEVGCEGQFSPSKWEIAATERGEGQQLFAHNTPPAQSVADRGFVVQYHHARCCSLLRLAQQEGIIHQSPSLDQRSPRVIGMLSSLPWHNPQGQWQWQHPTEYRLLWQLIWLTDRLWGENLEHLSAAEALREALSLCQVFEAFDKSCRIWGAVNIKTPELAQVRLGLVGITATILRILLEDHLKMAAPEEL